MAKQGRIQWEVRLFCCGHSALNWHSCGVGSQQFYLPAFEWGSVFSSSNLLA